METEEAIGDMKSKKKKTKVQKQTDIEEKSSKTRKPKTMKRRRKHLKLQKTTVLSKSILSEWKTNTISRKRVKLTPNERLLTYHEVMRYGFTFDMGPSWYWMPDVFEQFFARFGKKVSDYEYYCYGENK